jgi:hypothetical protein
MDMALILIEKTPALDPPEALELELVFAESGRQG